MSKALFAIYKNPSEDDIHTLSTKICRRIQPDNCGASAPIILKDTNSLSIIYNPGESIIQNENGICLGVTDSKEGLFEVGSDLPNGSFALFRHNNDYAEVATDFASSRTMWYYFDTDVFVAATSQRMIVALLGDFQLNEKACGWFMSSGTLGPRLSWDKRVSMIEPRTKIVLDKSSWELDIEKEESFHFEKAEESKITKEQARDQFYSIVENSIKDLKLNPEQWTLALSGGMDSRSLLYHLKDIRLNSVTWGHSRALDLPFSDACIAKRLADYCGIDNTYAKMDYQDGSFSSTLSRFLGASEGRLDHLAAYFDALSVWGNLSKTGRGVIRGYDAFGRKPPVTNSFQVYRNCNLLFTEYASPIIPQKYQVAENDIPKDLKRRENESLENWRDRLWLQHRTPITTAALEDIKLSYVEVINPLLNKNIVEAVQKLPIKLRNNKNIWFAIVSRMFPEIPFARREAVEEVGEVLSLPEVRDYICNGLKRYRSNSLFNEEFMDLLIKSYTTDEEKYDVKRRMRRLIIAYLPKSIENMIRARLKPSMVSNKWIAFRVLMILKVNDMFQMDAALKNGIKEKAMA